jgi:uncharacterized membrane-anchored protein YitT (DUF2179 family)
MNYIKTTAIKEYAMITLGSLLVAIAVVFYLVPCHLVTGSVSGLSLVLSNVLPVNNSLIVLLLNLLTYMIGALCLGKKFGIRSLYVSLLLPALIALLSPVSEIISLTSNSLIINIVAFLVILTSGQCILFLSDSASGGLDTIAEVISRRYGTSTGLIMTVLGLIVSLLTIGVYDFGTAVIGALVSAINGIMINLFIAAYNNALTLIHRYSRV